MIRNFEAVLRSPLAKLGGFKKLPGTMLVFGPTAYPYARLSQKIVPVTITTVGAVTLTADQLLSGLILRDPNGAGRSDTLPTAALLAAAMRVNSQLQVNDTLEFLIRNDADAAETITILTATGATLVGTMTIAQNNIKSFLLRWTNVTAGSEAYTLNSLGTSVF